MGRLARLFDRSQTSGLANPAAWLVDLLTGGKTTSGISVTEEKAMALPAVYSAVNRISSTVATLPLHVYRRTEQGKERAEKHPAYALLHDSPNPYMTAKQFRQALTGHALLWGNGYALIERNGAGLLVALWPLDPSVTSPQWAEVDGERRIVYQTTINGRSEQLMDYQVLHIAGLGFDGLKGYPVIRMEREAVALGLAMQEMTGRVVANNAVPPIVITRPDQIGFDVQERIVNAFKKMSAGGVGMLTEGMSITPLDIPLKDAEFLAQRNYTVLEVARMFNIPATLLDASDKAATYASAEQFNLWYVQHTVMPWLVAWEQALHLRLFVGIERRRYFAEHNVDGLLRADTAARSQFYKDMWDRAVFSVNDIRALENHNPIGPEGDKRFVPLNMVELSQAGKPQVEPVRQRMYPVYLDAYGRILRRAKADITREAERRAKSGTLDGFAPWLDEFLDGHRSWVADQLRPACLAEGRAGAEEDLARDHVKRLRDDLKSLISDPKTAGNALIMGISERFSVWLDNPKEVFADERQDEEADA